MRSATTGVRAIYSETDNAELNSILNTIQESIILPAYLPQKQRRIVFDPKKRNYLEQNPIDIEVEGHEHRFKSIDVAKDIPAAREMLWKALAAMKTKEDWANLGTILAGFRKARVVLSTNQQAKLMRLAIQNGQIGVLLECLKQARETGLYVANKEQLLTLFQGVNRQILDAEGDVAEIKQATRSGEIILDLIQRPDNMEKMVAGRDTRSFLHFSPLARGMLLHARVSLVKAKQQAEEPIDEDMVTIKDDLLLLNSLWAPHLRDGIPLSEFPELKEMNPAHTVQKANRFVPHAVSGSSYLQCLGWVIRGIKVAEELSIDEATPLLPLVESLETHAAEVIRECGEKSAKWAEEYEALKAGA